MELQPLQPKVVLVGAERAFVLGCVVRIGKSVQILQSRAPKLDPAISRDCSREIGWEAVMSSCLHLLLRLGPERAESFQ